MQQLARWVGPIVLGWGLGTATSVQVSGQVTAVQAREVLETSKASSFFRPMSGQVLNALHSLPPGSTDTARIDRVVRKHFSEDSLMSLAAQHMASQAHPDTFAALKGWLLAPEIRLIERKADSLARKESLEQFVARIQTNPPDESWVELIESFARAQRAGTFYVRSMLSLQKAVLQIASGAGIPTPSVPEPTAEQLEAAEQQFLGLGALSFLQRLEPLTGGEVHKMLDGYQSKSGVWYVTAYMNAIDHAIKEAAKRTLAELK